MIELSSHRGARWTFLIAGGAFFLAVMHACGSTTAGSNGGNGGAGGGCRYGLPVDPQGACYTEGETCFYGDTACHETWTCKSGKWSDMQSCYSWFTSSSSGG